MFNILKFKFHIVRKRCIENDFSMDDVCGEIGISKATLSRIERGSLPDIETFIKICNWLQVENPNIFFENAKK